MKWLVASNVFAIALMLWFAREHSRLSDRVSELESRKQRSHRVLAVPRQLALPHEAAPTLSSIEERCGGMDEQLRAPRRERPESLPPASRVNPPPDRAGSTPSSFARDQLEDIAEHFQLYDYDRSGSLSAEELSMSRAEIRRFDLNNDDELGGDEVSRLGELAAVARRATNDMTGAEFPIRRGTLWDRRLFSLLDSNQDGAATEDEYVAALADAVRQVRRFDIDHNGGLTHAELWDAPTRFARLDLDGDELVYAWEVLAAQGKGWW